MVALNVVCYPHAVGRGGREIAQPWSRNGCLFMPETTWVILRNLLVDRYDDFRNQLTRRFGPDVAQESLHETWLHLHRSDETAPIRSPLAFVMRVATNIARDRRRAEGRRLAHAEIEAALEIADPAPGPADQTQTRIELGLVQQAIKTLPERTRSVLIGARIDGLAHDALARRLGISRRTVFYELRRAAEHLDAHLGKNGGSACTPDADETS
ncbi:MAG: sigma-70 family RNA polymerase sigma factor [Bradyrhizobium sp.]|nr:sigma-70 family RNA polymerase sigma factor [Bradyrhizobium sp.]